MREQFRKVSQVFFVPADPVLDLGCFDVVLQKETDEHQVQISLMSALNVILKHIEDKLSELFSEEKYRHFGRLNFKEINSWKSKYDEQDANSRTIADQKKALFVDLFKSTKSAKIGLVERENDNDARRMTLLFGVTMAIVGIAALLAGGPVGWFFLGLGLVSLSVYVCSTYHQNQKKFDGLKKGLNQISEDSKESFKGGDGLLFGRVISKVDEQNQGKDSTFNIDEPPVPGLEV